MLRPAIVFLAVFIAGSGQMAAANPKTDICRILSSPSAFQGRRVEFFAVRVTAMETLDVSGLRCLGERIGVSAPIKGSIDLLPKAIGNETGVPSATFRGVIHVFSQRGFKPTVILEQAEILRSGYTVVPKTAKVRRANRNP